MRHIFIWLAGKLHDEIWYMMLKTTQKFAMASCIGHECEKLLSATGKSFNCNEKFQLVFWNVYATETL